MNDLTNVASERAVLAGIINHGVDCYLDIEAFLEEATFTVDHNKVIYKCISHIIHKVDKVDFVSILSAATDLSLGEYVGKPDVLKHIQGLIATPIGMSDVTDHAKKIRRLQFARTLQESIKDSYRALETVTGEENISQIVDLVEVPIQNASVAYLKKDDAKPKLLGEGGMEYFDLLMSNEVRQIGIPTGFPSYDAAIGGGLLRGCVDLVGARTKAQPLTAKILTPSGWKLMGDLNIGDEICHPSGGVSKVENIVNRCIKECFKFTFDDGSSTEATADHQWLAKSYRWKNYKVLSYDDMLQTTINEKVRSKWQFPLLTSVFFNKKEFFISPYILGVLIGDGSIKYTCCFTCFDKEISDRVKSELPNGMVLTLNEEKMAYRITTEPRLKNNPFTIELKRLELMGKGSHDKFIPQDYLLSSAEDRIALLNGLCDTDGSAAKLGGIEYTTTSKRLMEDICFLIKSLGGKYSVRYRSTTYTPEKRFYSYRIRFTFENNKSIFSLKRKSERCKIRTKESIKRLLRTVESIGYKEVQCITINNDDGLYITDDFIVTHNCGKSVFCDNIALHVSKLGIPVLVLDTEMSQEDHWNRVWANISGISINDIKFGTFKTDAKKIDLVREARDTLCQIPYHYKQVYGKGFDEILSIARRWILKEVGLQPNGRTKDCLIIYDYFKLMDATSISDSMQEYQAMGFQATKLHNFAVEFDCSVLSFVQLNRDGITKESADVISQSDRIGWLCTSFSILKEKSPEEMADDGASNGNRKLVPVLSRHGPGMDDGGYICLNMVGELARITEIGTVRNLRRHRDFAERDGGFDGTEGETETSDTEDSD